MLDEGESVDLIVSDLVMPRVGGVEMKQRLRSRSNEVPILYMSGYSHAFASRGAVGDSIVDFLQKPFTRSTLLLRVQELLMAPGAGEQAEARPS